MKMIAKLLLALSVMVLFCGCAAKKGYSGVTKPVISGSIEDISSRPPVTQVNQFNFPASVIGEPAMDSQDMALSSGDIGMQAYTAGNYALAVRYLENAVSISKVDGEARKTWIETLVAINWEQGKDYKLLNMVDSLSYLNSAEKKFWWCRVIERRGHLYEATDCWYSLGDQDRARRAVRAKIVVDAFLPPYTIVGSRPSPSDLR